MNKCGISLIYEINARVWLNSLSTKYGKAITLHNCPDEEMFTLKELGIDAIWLMGAWQASKIGRKIAITHQGLRQEFLSVLPDLKPDDVGASPYSITGYEPDAGVGGKEGLLNFKSRLNRRGMKLILDFVPNHTAIDHPWVKNNAGYYINGTVKEMRDNPGLFFSADGKTVLAHGKDPYFPAWTDVAQLNYFNPDARKAMQEELSKAAQFCDGLRCDMAMLILKKIQYQVWGERVFNGNKFSEPRSEFWQDAIAGIREQSPGFFFIAEAYWGLEQELASLGFDYVYDKAFYDALKDEDAQRIRQSLMDESLLAGKRLRFIENHDEERAAESFGEEKSRAACLIMLLASGAHLIHQGQMEGFTKKIPIQLLRQPRQEVNFSMLSFYQNLLSNLKRTGARLNNWSLMNSFPAWDANATFRNFFAFFNAEGYLSVVNYSRSQSQCYLHPDLSRFKSPKLLFKDLLGSAEYLRDSHEIASRGLYLDMPGYGFHLFKINGMN